MTVILKLKDAAAKIGISERQLRYLLTEGEIKGKKLGHDWIVLEVGYKRKREPSSKKREGKAES